MPRKLPPRGTNADLNLSTLAPIFSDEQRAREFLEAKRWPNGPVCPHCESTVVYTLKPRNGSRKAVQPGVYKCGKCRKQFTVRIDTIFEESKLDLSKWLAAIHLMTSSKKGVSSHQIARELGVTIKTAWFLTHRIREAMKEAPLVEMLQGEVEVDETYVGGRPRKGTGKHKRGWGTEKTPVMALVERGGRSRCRALETVDAKSLKGEIAVNVSKKAVIMTDELGLYKGLGRDYAGHETVKHSGGEYSRTTASGRKAHTNTAESFFALLKRGHYGTYHQMSKRHLFRYCLEFNFRWNEREISDGERLIKVITGAKGKRLMYKPPKNGKTIKALALSKAEKELLDSITH